MEEDKRLIGPDPAFFGFMQLQKREGGAWDFEQARVMFQTVHFDTIYCVRIDKMLIEKCHSCAEAAAFYERT